MRLSEFEVPLRNNFSPEEEGIWRLVIEFFRIEKYDSEDPPIEVSSTTLLPENFDEENFEDQNEIDYPEHFEQVLGYLVKKGVSLEKNRLLNVLKEFSDFEKKFELARFEFFNNYLRDLLNAATEIVEHQGWEMDDAIETLMSGLSLSLNLRLSKLQTEHKDLQDKRNILHCQLLVSKFASDEDSQKIADLDNGLEKNNRMADLINSLIWELGCLELDDEFIGSTHQEKIKKQIEINKERQVDIVSLGGIFLGLLNFDDPD